MHSAAHTFRTCGHRLGGWNREDPPQAAQMGHKSVAVAAFKKSAMTATRVPLDIL